MPVCSTSTPLTVTHRPFARISFPSITMTVTEPEPGDVMRSCAEEYKGLAPLPASRRRSRRRRGEPALDVGGDSVLGTAALDRQLERRAGTAAQHRPDLAHRATRDR